MLLSITLLTALASTLSTALPAPAPAASPVGCYPGAYVIVARASYEPVGEGRLAAVSQNILAQYPGSASVAVDYPATLKDYGSSLAQGAWDMTSKIVTYVNACGNSSKVVLLGYSQGAQVVAVTLAGNAATENSPGSQGLSTFYGKQIKAGVLLGDVSFTANQTFDAGNATTSGIGIRYGRSLAKLNTYASVIRSWCDAGDPFCASGNNFPVHTEYVEKYGGVAASFVLGLLRGGSK